MSQAHQSRPFILSESQLVDLLNNHLNIVYDGENIYRWYYSECWERYPRSTAIDWTWSGLRYELEKLATKEASPSRRRELNRIIKATYKKDFIEKILDAWLASVYHEKPDLNRPPINDLTKRNIEEI